MTDPEWEVLRPQAEAAMAELRRGPGGRPMDHQLRVVVDAVRYVVKYGVEWGPCRPTTRTQRHKPGQRHAAFVVADQFQPRGP